MSMEIFAFDKSLQERLVEYSEILTAGAKVIPASQIHSEWSCYVELVIEPVGWRALWKIPRLTCQDFEIHYPTIVVVEVENVHFQELSALVKIVAVQDEIQLPEKYDVPLNELYPTQHQENTVLDMIGTANCIDQLRFFFNYLWMPWDTDDDDDTDWVSLHLEPRIRLFFDMKRGVVNKETCDVIRSLTREGRDIQAKITRLEEDISDEEEDQDQVLDDGKACQLMKLHFRLQQIKTEMEVLENPVMREVLTRNKGSNMTDKEVKNRESRGTRSEGYFVWLGGSVQDMISSLSNVQTVIGPDMFLKTSNCLQEALDASEAGDIVVLGEGEHQIRGVGGLEEGGKFKGFGRLGDTVICGRETECGPSLMDFSGGEVYLEGISIQLGDLQMGLLARKGKVQLIGCRIFVTNKSVIKLGTVVLPGAKLIAQNTTFEGLGTAIVIHSGGSVTLDGCYFNECVEGIQMHDNSSLAVNNCSLSNFKEHSIRMETQKYVTGPEGKIGSSELLQNVSEINIKDCQFENNGKGDILFQAKPSAAFFAKQESNTNMVF
ncbi:protein nessun dorma [Neodiprion fabricii]|uniref:protein nessun dorma n=1 Tax=Neodiprion fabricii TaxID=2872261 RepID=UPI001ED94682|nr:protein nessun dorma [Neodiprion fabricii]